MSHAIRRSMLTLVGGVALVALVACGQPQPAAESGGGATASSQATQETSSLSETQSTAPAQPEFAVAGNGWGLVYPSYWQGKVTSEAVENPTYSKSTFKTYSMWEVKTSLDNVYSLLSIADVEPTQEFAESMQKVLKGTEVEGTKSVARPTLASGQTANVLKNQDGTMALVAELPNGHYLIVGGSDEIPSNPGDLKKKELNVRCEMQSFGKKTSWEDYNEAFVQSFLEQIAGYIYAT